MSDVPEKKRHTVFNSKSTRLSLFWQSIGTRNWISMRKGYIFQTCSSSSPSLPHSSSLRLYDLILSSLFLCFVASSSHSSSYDHFPYHHSQHCLIHKSSGKNRWKARGSYGTQAIFRSSRKPHPKECLNESAAQSTVMSQFFFKLPWKKQGKGVWNVRWPFIYEAVPFFCGGPSLYYASLACSLCPASVRSFVSPGIQNQERAAPLRVAEDLGRTPTEVSCYARKQKWGRGHMMASLGIVSRFFFGKNVSGVSHICMNMRLQDKLLVTSVYKNRMDWMWLIKMTCSSAFLNYLNLVKRLGVLMDCIGLNHLHSWYQCWSQSKFTQFADIVDVRGVATICRFYDREMPNTLA